MGGQEAHRRALEQLPALAAAQTEAGRLGRLVDAVREVLPEARVAALAWTGEGAAIRLQGVAGTAEALPGPAAVSRSLLAEVARTGRAVWLASPGADPRFAEAASLHTNVPGAIGVVPLGEGAALSVLPAGALPGTFERQQVEALAALVARLRRPRPALPPPPSVPGLVGGSRAMEELRTAVAAFAQVGWPALVLGETGTGKEVVARALHALSPRADGPFVAVNAAAIPDELAESTLFGHERGAFTGADRPRAGLVERAEGGTLFLDEIGDVSPRVQTRLLRLLQEGTYERVGGSREQRFTGRIVAATLRPVDTDTPGFRADLYYRLAACVLRVPPLRERAEDIPALAEHLFRRAVGELPVKLELADEAVDALRHRDWPGNVRELENVLRGAIAAAWAARAEVVGPQHLPTSGRLPGGAGPGVGGFGGGAGVSAGIGAGGVGAAPGFGTAPGFGAAAFGAAPGFGAAGFGAAAFGAGGGAAAGPAGAADLGDATEAFQRARVAEALRLERGNRAAAARRLGVSKQWLHRLLNRWGREEFEPAR